MLSHRSKILATTKLAPMQILSSNKMAWYTKWPKNGLLVFRILGSVTCSHVVSNVAFAMLSLAHISVKLLISQALRISGHFRRHLCQREGLRWNCVISLIMKMVQVYRRSLSLTSIYQNSIMDMLTTNIRSAACLHVVSTPSVPKLCISNNRRPHFLSCFLFSPLCCRLELCGL